MLALETLFLAVFCFLMLAGPPVTDAEDWHGILAGAFAAMAMGAQSAMVRLLMRGIPQTNVMTGNMTQLGIATTELLLAWRRQARDRDELARERIPRRAGAAARSFCPSPPDFFSAPLPAPSAMRKPGLPAFRSPWSLSARLRSGAFGSGGREYPATGRAASRAAREPHAALS